MKFLNTLLSGISMRLAVICVLALSLFSIAYADSLKIPSMETSNQPTISRQPLSKNLANLGSQLGQQVLQSEQSKILQNQPTNFSDLQTQRLSAVKVPLNLNSAVPIWSVLNFSENSTISTSANSAGIPTKIYKVFLNENILKKADQYSVVNQANLWTISDRLPVRNSKILRTGRLKQLLPEPFPEHEIGDISVQWHRAESNSRLLLQRLTREPPKSAKA